MTFEEFCKRVARDITEGWMEDAEVSIQQLKKNNGIVYNGLYVLRQDRWSAPIIYLEKYYSDYLKGEPVEEIVGRIRSEYEQAELLLDESQLRIEDYGFVKDSIVYRLVNYEKNREILKNCPYIRLYDLAVTFRFLAHNSPEGISSALICNEELKLWKVTKEDILLAAKENTPRLFPPRRIDLTEIIPAEELWAEELDEIEMYVITNTQQINGATVAIYDGFLKQTAEELDTDFYVIPSSIHEMILIPSGKVDYPEELFPLVENANRTLVSPGDVLSDTIYYYEAGTDRLLPLVIRN